MTPQTPTTSTLIDLGLLQPFGVVVNRRRSESDQGDSDSITSIPVEQIFSLVREHKVVVFRGFQTLPKQDLALFAQTLGKPLQWPFGAINELIVKPDTENYLFTSHEVPFHWDGAFVGLIPHIILFQCLVAPALGDLGGTTFSDTNKILASLPPSKREQWAQVSVHYATERVVHYGGNITQPLILKHETERQEHHPQPRDVIRYAEPVDDLNPVTLEVRGLNSRPEEFIDEMKELLYDPEFLLTHRWEDGDILLADNHVLLHGREAFANPNQRHIQRINILHRPSKPTLRRFLNNCLTIRRKEFFVAELPIFMIPLLLNLRSWATMTKPALFIGLLALFLLFNLGDIINCYADYELDSIYKSHLSNAVYELGKRNVALQVVLSGAVGFALTVIVSLMTHRLYLIPITIFGAIVGLQYSIEPFKFKSRGVLQLLCLWGIIFFGPMLYSAIVAKGFPPPVQMLMLSLYGFHQMGIIMLNTAEDYTEDKATGLNTIIIHLGLHRAMNFAYAMVIATGVLLTAATGAFFAQHRAPWYVYVPLLVFLVGWRQIVVEYRIVIVKVSANDERGAVEVIKKNGMMVPRWLKIGAYGYTLSLLGFFVWNLTT